MRYWAQRASRIWQPAYLGGVLVESWADEGVTQHTVPRAKGTAPPAATFSGTGLVGGKVVPYLQCDGAGVLGAATYKVSYDDGATFPHTGILTSGSATPLPGIGSAISVAFANAAFLTDNIWESIATTVNDRHGTKHATQATAANMPIYRAVAFNGRPALDWGAGGTGKKLDTPSITTGAFTWLLLLRGDANALHPIVHNADAGANGGYLYGAAAPSNRIERGGVVQAKNAGAWLQDGVRKTACLSYNGTNATTLFYVNGAAHATTDIVATDPGTANASGPIYIGAQQAGTSPFRGLMVGWTVVNRALSAAEVKAWHNYAIARFPL